MIPILISIKRIIVTCIIFVSLMSCNGSKKRSALEVVDQFMEAVKKNDEASYRDYYPDCYELSWYFNSDAYEIRNVEMGKRNQVLVSLLSYFSNNFGKSRTQDMTFYLEPDSVRTYKIVDSKGFANYTNDNNYRFAKNIGAVGTEVTDLGIAAIIKQTDSLYLTEVLKLYTEISFGLTIKNVNWRASFGSSAYGSAIVQNTTKYNIPYTKYKAVFYNKTGGKITSEEGYVTYDILYSGSSRSFTFFSPYVADASRVNVSVYPDYAFVENIVANTKYEDFEFEDKLR